VELATKTESLGKSPGKSYRLASIATISCLTLVGASLLTAEKTLAQLIPDASLGNSNSAVSPNVNIDGLPSDRIDGGAIRGGNLFHSFSEFNVPEGRGVYFANPAAIDRILTRVTGGNASQIFGTLGVLGKADLFLINPNGILFGPKARLDLRGSFIGSSANSVIFDNYNFSASNPEAPPLVTINVPLGLQYGQNPGTIINRSTAGLAENPDTAGLGVKPGNTLALVGGDIVLEGGVIATGEGRIELGSVGSNAQVSLAPTELGWYLGYKDVPEFRDIRLSQGAIVNGSGEFGSDIQIAGRNLALTEGSLIYYFNNGSSTGGDIAIRTAESIEMGGGLNPTTGNNTSIAIGVFGDGPGGNITIETSSLRTREGAGIASFTVGGGGKAGDVTVRASDFVELIGTDPSNLELASGLGSQVLSAGDGGDVTVETRRLIIRDGALISASTFDAGNSGNVTVKASDSVELIGTNSALDQGGGIAASAEPDATGNGGSVTVETPRLIVRDGAKVTSATLGEGNAGSLTVKARESIQLSGSAPGESEARRIGFFASTEEDATGNAGSLQINTSQLTIEEGAAISVTTNNAGLGGDIILNVDRLRARNGARVTANSLGSGNGGTVTINATELVEVRGNTFLDGENRNSSLSTTGEGSGNAGSLNINTNQLRVTDTGQLTVSSTGSGNAGNLTVNARSLRLDTGAQISAESSAGLGNINLNIADNLQLSGNSSITTNSTGDDPGGNIDIITGSLIASDNSDITANAQNAAGGQVSIAADGIFGTEFRSQGTDQSDITATSELGASFSGTVEIETPDADPTSGLVELPRSVIDVEQLVATDLCSPEELQKSTFVIIGRGGLAPDPQNDTAIWQPLLEWASPEGVPPRVSGGRNVPNASDRENLPTRTIRQAQGWIKTADGTVVLTAGTPVVTPSGVGLLSPGGCR